jgi:hypothetical protein
MRADARRHRIEHAGKQRHVAERVGHQQQQDKGLEKFGHEWLESTKTGAEAPV